MKPKEDRKFFYVEIEASNENPDLQGQVVSQEALINSKSYFLSNGIISVNHRHRKRLPDGRIITDERYCIGEPVSVYTEGKSTWVIAKLYKANPLAKVVIELVRKESDAVKASIGGLSPRIRVAPDGKQIVTEFIWNDLSIAVNPVNNTLQPVRALIKSNLTGIKRFRNTLCVTQLNDIVLPKKIPVKKGTKKRS